MGRGSNHFPYSNPIYQNKKIKVQTQLYSNPLGTAFNKPKHACSLFNP